MINVSICSRHAGELANLLAANPQINITQQANTVDDLNPKIVHVLLADPDLAAQLVDTCENLVWMQSTWAGNAPLLTCANQNFMLTVARGIFDSQIREYVFAYLLTHCRKVFSMDIATPNNNQSWQSVTPSYLKGKTLGVLGTGSLAIALLPVSQVFGLRVVGLSRTAKHVDGFDHVYGMDEKSVFAQASDFIVNVLPDTPSTRGCLDHTFFHAMKENSLFINAGRGSAVAESALIEGLANNTPSFAVLDVFDVEPLPANHPFWQHEQIHITHHTAATTNMADVAKLFEKNIDCFIKKQPMHYEFDWALGY